MKPEDRPEILLEHFLGSLEEMGYRPATVSAWRGSLRRFFEFVQSQGVNSVHVPLELCLSFGKTLSKQGLREEAVTRHENRMIAFYIWFIKRRRD